MAWGVLTFNYEELKQEVESLKTLSSGKECFTHIHKFVEKSEARNRDEMKECLKELGKLSQSFTPDKRGTFIERFWDDFGEWVVRWSDLGEKGRVRKCKFNEIKEKSNEN